METIRVVLDTKLRKAADAAAKRQRMNRPALIRHALQEHLKRLHELELEEQDRRGYTAQPQREEELRMGGCCGVAGTLSRSDVRLCDSRLRLSC